MCLKYAAAVLSTLATGVVRTVGSLDVVNAQVAARGLQERLLLPFLVVDTVDCIEPVHDPAAMPPRRRAAGRGPGGRVLPHIQTRQKRRNEPRNNGDQATTKPIAVVHKEKVKSSYYMCIRMAIEPLYYYPLQPPADVDHTKPTTKTSLIEVIHMYIRHVHVHVLYTCTCILHMLKRCKQTQIRQRYACARTV